MRLILETLRYLWSVNALPHGYWVTSAKAVRWFPSRFNNFSRGVIRNPRRRCVILLCWRSNLKSLLNSTPSIDVNDVMELKPKASIMRVFAMRFSPKGVLINPLWNIYRYLILLRWLKLCASLPWIFAEKLTSKCFNECPICSNDCSWCNWVCLSLRRSNTKSPLNAFGWTYLTGFNTHENTCNCNIKPTLQIWCFLVYK